MKEYLRAVCLCAAIVVVVLFATGMVWYGYLVTAALFGLTRGETATAALGIALVAGAVKAYREQRRQGVRREAIEKAIQLWEALMAKQRYEMPPGGVAAPAAVLRPDRRGAEKRAGQGCKTRRSEKEPGNRRGFVKWPSTFPTCRRNTRPRP